MNRRLENLSEYHFVKIQDIVEKYKALNRDIFDFSIGDPDIHVDINIINSLAQNIQNHCNLKYPPYEGILPLKKEIIKYYNDIYSVKLELDEIIILIGSKEGISNIIPAICDIGDGVILPDPGYPVYEACSKLWGAVGYKVPLQEKFNYLPDLKSIPDSIVTKSKMFFINYPNNPTGAVADEGFYKEIVDFGYRNDITICNDGAYQEIINAAMDPVSLLQFDYKKKHIEFGTFSKTYNMTGFRLGYAVGNRKIISSLLKVKSNMDSGQFIPIQYAGIQALKEDRNKIYHLKEIYEERKIIVKEILDRKKIKYFDSCGTFYLWCKVPEKYNSNDFFMELIESYGIVVTPGEVFGRFGQGHFRIALTKDVNTIEKSFNMLTIYE